MTNNDVLRALRYALELDPTTMLGLFGTGGGTVSARELAGYLKEPEEVGALALADAELARFLDGLVAKYRGVREGAGGEVAGPLTNNRILRALKIAFALRDVELLGILERAGVAVSKSELSALFRRPEHRNYQPCGDQFLRQFLRGLGVWHRQGQPRDPSPRG